MGQDNSSQLLDFSSSCLQLRTKLVSEFVCTADKCVDTCCKHWSMQVDAGTIDRYKKEAPELLEFIEKDSDSSFIMRKDAQTGYCIKFEDGKCGIQLKYGEAFLGDACNFYPRITRRAGDMEIVAATMSCPEIARIALYGEQPFTLEEASLARLPQEMKNILPEELTQEEVIKLHTIFIEATEDKDVNAERVFARISSASRSLQRIDKKNWLNAAPMYLRLADSGLPDAEMNINDPFNLLHSLCGLVVASKKVIPPRLQQTISEMEAALCVKLYWKNIAIVTSDESIIAYEKLRALWQNEMQEVYSPLLKRWLGAQLSSSFYPFAGLGETLPDKVTIIGVRFAILRLALLSAYSINMGNLHQDDVVRVVQSLSRFLEHLAEPKFSLEIYAETGWSKENRMLGLLF